ncbi:hypothetical protein POTOM_049019 [Populus tomentosa]|uniref:Protein kinase domain-containing protein n=1 Tax=Populus tomentosa TaxID=118781 RepID=A0A8X7YD47_POPTO|nr:hypothetical protein POTOM_049019 [Populus tomentosa]
MLGTECYDKPKSARGTTRKIVAAGGLSVLLAFISRSDKAAKENLERVERFLEDYKALKAARYSYADIKRITNDFKEILVLGKSVPLGWKKLQDFSLGVTRGNEYLHQGCDQRILHFDIKLQNILLVENCNPKISDFGLAKSCSKVQSAVSMTTARGTMAYSAPEVFSRNFGNACCKSDVHCFGMVLLAIVGGRKNTDDTAENNGQVYFPEWIYNCLDGGEELRLKIQEAEDAEIAKKLAIVGFWCIQWHPMDRPSMKTEVQMLEGEGNIFAMPQNPFASASAGRMDANMASRQLHHDLVAIPEGE